MERESIIDKHHPYAANKIDKKGENLTFEPTGYKRNSQSN
jgi:hypothetical protein